MADPRLLAVGDRPNPLSNLMQAKAKANTGDTVNFCPFGCQDYELDEHGYCAHLVGFTNGGNFYEPRSRDLDVHGAKSNRITTYGSKRRPMERGMKLVRITTSARVYSPNPVADLVPPMSEQDIEYQDFADRERQVQAMAAEVMRPKLEGDWTGTIYDKGFMPVRKPGAAKPAPPPEKPLA